MQIMDTFIVLMSTRNVEMRAIEPNHKMNRKRRKNGKTLLQPVYDGGHSVRILGLPIRPKRVRIVGAATAIAAHASAPGHIRRQHYGKGLEQIKRIWIKPVLVNSTADAEVRHDYHVHTQ